MRVRLDKIFLEKMKDEKQSSSIKVSMHCQQNQYYHSYSMNKHSNLSRRQSSRRKRNGNCRGAAPAAACCCSGTNGRWPFTGMALVLVMVS